MVLLGPAPVQKGPCSLPCTAGVQLAGPALAELEVAGRHVHPDRRATVMVTSSVAVQPLAFSALTVYVVVFVGRATGHVGGAQRAVVRCPVQVMPGPSWPWPPRDAGRIAHGGIGGHGQREGGSTVRYTESV